MIACMSRVRIRMANAMAKISQKTRYAEKALRVLFLYLVIFSAVHTVLTAVTGVEQTTLIEQTFLVFGIEAGGLLLKRIVEKIFGKKKVEDEENDV